MNSDFEKLRKLLIADRSIRRFKEDVPIGKQTLKDLVELVRYCASGRNLQPLKYRLVFSPDECGKVYPHLKWAGYLRDWDGPTPGERPAAYLVQCLDMEITTNPLCDEGLQLQAITLGACALGIGACIIKSFNVAAIKDCLNIPSTLSPTYILALGYPAEGVTIESMSTPADYKYYRTPDGIHHVPKRPIEELIVK